MIKPLKTYYVVAAAISSLFCMASAQATGTREALALEAATVSLVQAVDIGEKKGGGRAVGAEFDIEKDRAIWEIKILGVDGVMEYKVDAQSGQVVKIEDEHVRGKLMNFVTGTNLTDLESVKTTFAQAVAMAEREANGKAVKVEVEHEHDQVQFDVFVRSGDKTEKVKIDAMTGKVLSARRSEMGL